MYRLLALLLVVPCLALAQAAPTLGYQGRLLRADGQPETGTVNITYSFWDSATGGQRLWTEVQPVALSDGFYSTYLGSVTPFPATVFTGVERFLEVEVGGAPMTPRQRVASVAYALRAAAAATARDLEGGTVNATQVQIGGTTVIDGQGRLVGPAAPWTAGAGLQLTGNTLSLLTGCTSGQVLQASGTTWVCGSQGAAGVTAVTASGPLSSSGGAAPELSLTGIVPIANGGTGSALQNFVDLATSQTIAGTKTFSSPIAASVTGTASGFTGALAGDVAGTQGATRVSALQGRAVSNALPTSGDALRWNATATRWEPAASASGTVTSVTAGAGLTGGPITGAGSLAIAPAGVTNTMLLNDGVTVIVGPGLSGGGTVALGSSVTVNNAGVLSVSGAFGQGLTVTGTASAPQVGLTPCGANQVLAQTGAQWQCATRVAALGAVPQGGIEVTGTAANPIVGLPGNCGFGQSLVSNNFAQWSCGNPAPSGTAGGDLFGNYPNPSLGQVVTTAHFPTRAIPAVRTQSTLSTSIVPATWTTLSLGNESFGTQAMHDTAVNAERITVTVRGIYQVCAKVRWSGGTITAGAHHAMRVFASGPFINGNFVENAEAQIQNFNYGNVLSACELLALSVGDVLQLQVFHTTSVAQSASGTLNVNWIGPQ